MATFIFLPSFLVSKPQNCASQLELQLKIFCRPYDQSIMKIIVLIKKKNSLINSSKPKDTLSIIYDRKPVNPHKRESGTWECLSNFSCKND